MGVHCEEFRENQLFDRNLDFKIKIMNFVRVKSDGLVAHIRLCL